MIINLAGFNLGKVSGRCGIGMVERVFSEENGDFEKVCATLRDALSEEFTALLALTEIELTQKRYDKFRRIGGDEQ